MRTRGRRSPVRRRAASQRSTRANSRSVAPLFRHPPRTFLCSFSRIRITDFSFATIIAGLSLQENADLKKRIAADTRRAAKAREQREDSAEEIESDDE